ncbi:MAG: CHASE2 domain-containing protein [Calditrichia bacterium]|nr:CHASE2 domain-containing protein [Calditrichia bacterium]
MALKKNKHKEKPLYSVLISVVAILFALLIGQTTTFISLEHDLLDYRFKMRGSIDISDSPIIILAIDDQSDESTPARWPWPREYFAHVIENLIEAEVKAIGIDVIFEQADFSPGGEMSDQRFADILAQHNNVVLAGKLMVPTGRADIITLVPPYEKFVETGVPWGLVSFNLDEDGFYRRYLVGQTYNDRIYPSFAAALLKIYANLDPNTEVLEMEDRFVIGPYSIPKINSYSSIINYMGPSGTFPRYSFDAVLDDVDFDLIIDYDLDSFDDPGDEELGLPPGLLASGMLKDKIILIGSTVVELHDDFPTPFLQTRDEEGYFVPTLTYGVEIHANMLQMILSENYLHSLPYIWELLLLVLLGVLVFIITRYLPTFGGVFVMILLLVLYFVSTFVLFGQWNTIIQVSTPILVILLTFGGHTIYRYVLSQHEKKMITGAFAHYVPAKVVDQILADPEKLSLGGEEREVTVMFTDVAGFTSLSERLTPAELVKLLNEYLTEMTDTVLAHDGIIDKYEGDAIMAEFGVPVPYDNHAFMACKTAIEMQKKLIKLREKWEKEGKPELRARIGINTGVVIVGNMGSRDVFDYTVMGDHVNLGSRLEGANKFYGTEIMISEFTYDYIKDEFHTRELDLIRVKGKDKPIKVFQLIKSKKEKVSEDFLKMLDVYNKGIQHYKIQEWSEAIDCFEACLNYVPEDPPSVEYRSRCIEFKFNSPGPDWDGITVMKEK